MHSPCAPTSWGHGRETAGGCCPRAVQTNPGAASTGVTGGQEARTSPATWSCACRIRHLVHGSLLVLHFELTRHRATICQGASYSNPTENSLKQMLRPSHKKKKNNIYLRFCRSRGLNKLLLGSAALACYPAQQQGGLCAHPAEAELIPSANTQTCSKFLLPEQLCC